MSWKVSAAKSSGNQRWTEIKTALNKWNSQKLECKKPLYKHGILPRFKGPSTKVHVYDLDWII